MQCKGVEAGRAGTFVARLVLGSGHLQHELPGPAGVLKLPDMYENIALLRDDLKTAHAASWAELAQPGAFLTGEQRLAVVGATRAAGECALCARRKAALSPFAVSGTHDCAGEDADRTPLDAPVVDMIHRLSTDPGRLTRAWFDTLIAAGVRVETYVELVSLVTTSVIVDTLHRSLGLALPELPESIPGPPTGAVNEDAVDAGAWVPVLSAARDIAESGLPTVPNIARAMGLVPSAVALFFRTFRPHYQLKDIKLSISQAQTEFVAARVSSLNECFY